MDEDMNQDETNNTDIVDIHNAEATSKNVQELINQQVNGGGPVVNPLSNRKSSKNSQPAQILQLQDQAKKVSHEEWVRRKNHETKLRQKLIIEAKRDLLETLVAK